MNTVDIPHRAIIAADEIFVALCTEGTRRPGNTPVYHAVTPYCRIALCTAEPGVGSAWAEPPAKKVTCLNCLMRLADLERSNNRHPRQYSVLCSDHWQGGRQLSWPDAAVVIIVGAAAAWAAVTCLGWFAITTVNRLMLPG